MNTRREEIIAHTEQVARKWEHLAGELEIYLYSHNVPNSCVSLLSFCFERPGQSGRIDVHIAREQEDARALLDVEFASFPDLNAITTLGWFYNPIRLLLVVDDQGSYWKLPSSYVEEKKLPLVLEYVVILGVFLFLPEYIEDISNTQEFQKIKKEWLAWLHDLGK